MSWRRAADRLAEAGRRPLFRSVAAATQFSALHGAAGAPILVVPLDPARPERAAPLIAAMEWCRRRGDGGAVARKSPAGAALGSHPPRRARRRGAARGLGARARCAAARGRRQGRAVERRMRAALAADAALAGLFADEVTLRLGPAFTPRVDLLWAAGKVVVELDGAEHERDPNYGADRHRDYELLMAGYLVLRLTNAEVELDLARALEKVRSVVNLRRGSS